MVSVIERTKTSTLVMLCAALGLLAYSGYAYEFGFWLGALTR